MADGSHVRAVPCGVATKPLTWSIEVDFNPEGRACQSLLCFARRLQQRTRQSEPVGRTIGQGRPWLSARIETVRLQGRSQPFRGDDFLGLQDDQTFRALKDIEKIKNSVVV